ncbi:RNA polymerase subunit sigma [Solibacillus daqui]|uniref:RNA polymerase subunit sigma n=1 Tax=Solibacillus daqui TaxID=2912187 RepID=UPI002365235A|nr:RNA polymerase subunit sigma [Solibacillus daqui]
MSLKGIELQIAIPKTFDAGKVADQQQQNSILQQMHANEALKKEIERKQFTVNETEKMDVVDGEEERENEQGQSPDQQVKKKKQQLQQKVQHPFKGNFVDFSG